MERAITLPLDVVERVLDLAWRYGDLREGLPPEDVDALELVGREVVQVKAMAPARQWGPGVSIVTVDGKVFAASYNGRRFWMILGRPEEYLTAELALDALARFNRTEEQ